MTIKQAQQIAEANLTDGNGGLYDERKDVYVDTDRLTEPFNPKKRFGVKITNTLANQKRLILHPGLLVGKRPVKVMYETDDPLNPTYSRTYYFAPNGTDKIIVKDYGTTVAPETEYGYYILVDDDVTKLEDNGIVADGIMRDGIVIQEGNENLKVEAITGSTIDFFRDFVSENPTLVGRLVINSNQTSVYSNTIFVKPISPFEDKAEDKIYLNDYFHETAERTEKITVTPKTPIPFDDEHVISLDIPGGSAANPVEVTIEFLVGVTESKSRGLRKKHEIARKRDEILKLK